MRFCKLTNLKSEFQIDSNTPSRAAAAAAAVLIKTSKYNLPQIQISKGKHDPIDCD